MLTAAVYIRTNWPITGKHVKASYPRKPPGLYVVALPVGPRQDPASLRKIYTRLAHDKPRPISGGPAIPSRYPILRPPSLRDNAPDAEMRSIGSSKDPTARQIPGLYFSVTPSSLYLRPPPALRSANGSFFVCGPPPPPTTLSTEEPN